ANFGYTWALVLASLVNRTQRQRIVPRAMLGRVTSGVRVLFLAMDPLGVVIAGAVTSALGGDPRPVFLAAGAVILATAAGGGLAGPRRARPGRMPPGRPPRLARAGAGWGGGGGGGRGGVQSPAGPGRRPAVRPRRRAGGPDGGCVS